MAGEIVETTRLWARTVAPVTAAQVEEVGAHLVKRTYAEPHWSTRQAAVMAYETVTLFGVPIVAGRRVGVRAGSTRSRPGRSSSAPRWSRAGGAPGTRSSRTTSGSGPRPPSWRSGPGGVTWWSTTR